MFKNYKDWKISSLVSFKLKGSTTIPIGSTLQMLSNGNRSYPEKDKDIVYSLWKHKAVHKRTLIR